MKSKLFLKILFFSCLILKILDLFTTYKILNITKDFNHEANPIMKFALNNLGLNYATLLNGAIFLLVCSIGYKKKAFGAFMFIFFLYSLVVVNNFVQLGRLM